MPSNFLRLYSSSSHRLQLGTSRMVFGLHRAGYAFPMRMVRILVDKQKCSLLSVRHIGSLSSIPNCKSSLIYPFLSAFLLPVPQALRASSGGNDWVGVMEEIGTTSSFLLFLNESSGWRVQACCKSSQALLGIDLIAMRAGAVSLTNYLSDIPGVIR